MVRKLVLAVAAASALMSSNMVQALGVGEIHLRSTLNQPLEAEIELLQVRDLTSGDIRSVLASADAFGKAGIDRSFFLTDLKFTPMVRSDGKAVIKVTSTRPVKEPYLNFLMEVRWPSGRVLREFTLLLDPPMYQPTPVTAAAARTIPAASNAATGTLAKPAPAMRPAPAAPAPSAVAAAPPASAPGQWQASRKDTLWEIALQNRPGSASVHQTMLAIQDLNPNAFIAGNINSLKAGQTLTLPTAEQASARSRTDAVAEVASQTAAWQSRQPAAQIAERQLDARERSAAGAAPAFTEGGDALRLVSGNDESADNHTDSAADGQNGGLRDALDRTKEQLDSTEREKVELNERLADVQAQLQTLQRLVALKDAQLAALQQELGSEGELPDILPVPVENSDEMALVVPLDEAEAAATEAEANTAAELEVAPPEEGTADAAVINPETPAVISTTEPEAVAVPVVVPEAQEQRLDSKSPESLLQQFMQNQSLLLGAGAAALLLLLLLLMAVARRNARREMELHEGFDVAPPAPNDDAGDEGDEFNMALATSADADLGINQDPLTEADGLIAYAKLDEAAQVLASAIEQEPERADLRLKMMEVEARRENPEGYAAQAEALRAAGMADDAVDMMNLRYPLMAAGLMTGAMLLDSGVESEADEEPEEIAVEPVSLESDDADLDFSNFGLEEDAAASLAESSVASDGYDLDFDLDETPSADTPAATDTVLGSDISDEMFSIDLSADTAPVAAATDEDELVLDDELQSDSLLAEFEAMSLADASDELEALAGESAGETEVDEQTFSVSDDDLAGFEAELQASLETESKQVDAARTHGESLSYLAESAVSEDDLDGDDFDFLTDTDECATKLDLARAYIDMGDAEGARDILTEVVDEGNVQQQQDAREMMEQLS